LHYHRPGLRASGTQRARRWRFVARRNEYPDLHAFCLFVGYPKSGHSLVGALLDAHPDIVIARATNPLALVVEDGLSRAQVFEMLLESSRHQATRGRKQNRYRYTVEGQWQGRVRALTVIGDKFSDRTTKRIRRTPAALAAFEREVRLPLRLIHVTRNPFDMVARIAISKIEEGTPREKVAKATQYLARLAAVNDEVIAAGTPPVLTVRHESLIENPRDELQRVCDFLGVETDDSYLDACARIVFPSPQRTRERVDWDETQVGAVEDVIARHDFFQDYALAEPR
jgi:hypothetical protein